MGFKSFFKGSVVKKAKGGENVNPLSTYSTLSLSELFGIEVAWRTLDYLSLMGGKDYANSWVAGCVKALREAISATNFRFYQTTKEGPKLLPDNHPLVQLFWSINPFTTRNNFWQLSVTHYLLAGECFWALDGFKGKTPTKLWVLPPDKVIIIPDRQKFIKAYHYRYSPSDPPIEYEPSEIIHTKIPDPTDPYRGLSPLASARFAVLCDYWASVFNMRFFKQGAKLSAKVTTEQDMDDITFQKFKQEIETAYSGAEKAHKTIVMPKGTDMQEMGLSHKDMEFVEMFKTIRERILSVYKVPPIKVGVLEFANYANSKTQDKIFWTDAVIPLMRVWEESINTFLAPVFGKDIYGEFDISSVEALRENELEKADIAQRVVASGIWTQNEARRRLWRLAPVSWGNAYWGSIAQVQLGVDSGEAKSIQGGGIVGKSFADDFSRWYAYWGERQETSHLNGNPRLLQWQDFVIKSLKHEHGFEAFMKDFFKDQHKRIMRKVLNAIETQKLSWPSERLAMPETYKTLNIVSKQFEDLTEGEVELLASQAEKLFDNILKGAGRESAERWRLGITFDPQSPRALNYLRSKPLQFSKTINQTTAKNLETALAELRAELGEGVRLGEAIPQIADRVNQVFEFATRTRAVMIARTEVHDVSTFANQESYLQADAWGRGWLTAGDENVRETHVEAGIRYVEGLPFGELFEVGGYQLERPGDGSHGAGVEEIVNCRCLEYPLPIAPKSIRREGVERKGGEGSGNFGHGGRPGEIGGSGESGGGSSSETAGKIIDRVKELKPKLDTGLQDVASAIPGANTTESRVKTEESLKNKMERYKKTGRSPDDIADVLAGRVILEKNKDNINKAVEEVSKKGFKVIEDEDWANNPSDWGYNGRNLKVKMGETLTEVQVITHRQRYVIEKVHPVYEKWRDNTPNPGHTMWGAFQKDMMDARVAFQSAL